MGSRDQTVPELYNSIFNRKGRSVRKEFAKESLKFLCEFFAVLSVLGG